MSSLTEGVKKILAIQKESKGNVLKFEGLGGRGHQYKEWDSPDGKKRIIVHNYGGREYGNVYYRNIYLLLIKGVATGMMMRVEAILSPNIKEPEYIVYIDAFSKESGPLHLNTVTYTQSSGGSRQPITSSSFLIKAEEYAGLSDDEFEQLCKNYLKKEGIHGLDEMPIEIDVKATIEAFMEQIKKKVFSPPKLIPKNPNLTNRQQCFLNG